MVVRFLFGLVLLFASASKGEAAITCYVSMSDINFGAPALLAGAAVNTTGTLSVSCSGAPTSTVTYYCVSIGAGSGGVSGTTRRTTSSTGTLLYNLYQDGARTASWGGRASTTLGTVLRRSNTGASFPAFITVYATLAAGQQSSPPGSYSSSFGSGQASFYPLASGSSDCVAGAQDSVYPISFSVLAAPVANCTVIGDTLDFGTSGVLAANVDATATIGVTCTSTTPYAVGLGNGSTGTAPTARKMTNGSNSILYALYTDSARTSPWSTTTTVAGTGTGASQPLTVYGRVAPQTTPPVGAYSDTVVITVTF